MHSAAAAGSSLRDSAQALGRGQIQIDDGAGSFESLVEDPELHPLNDPRLLGDQLAMTSCPLLRGRLDPSAVNQLPVVGVDVHDRDRQATCQLRGQRRLA